MCRYFIEKYNEDVYKRQTQGSGKTALSYYLTYVLSDYFSKQNKVAKFYLIVDGLDLLKQASEEFEARGLVVETASSRAELMEQFRSAPARPDGALAPPTSAPVSMPDKPIQMTST